MTRVRTGRRHLRAICASGLLLVAACGAPGCGPAPREPGTSSSGGPAAPPDVAAAPPTLAPDGVPRDDADLPHTRLPLRLLATVLRQNRSYSLATLVDLERGTSDVMSEGQRIAGHADARIARIERGRVLIDRGDVREQLVITPDTRPAVEVAPEPPAPEAAEREAPPAEPAAGDDVTAVFENGEMLGVRVDEVRPGSLYARLGLQRGDLLTEINGVPLSDPAAAARVLAGLPGSDELVVAVEREDGSQQTLRLPTSELARAPRPPTP